MTDIAIATADAAQAAPPRSAAPGLGGLLLACAILSVVLLVAHPGGGGPAGIGEVLKREAAGQGIDALVHGGEIAVQAALLVGLSVLAARLGASRAVVIAGLTLSAIGFAALAASLLVDGLVVPAIAARYVSAPATAQAEARPLLVLAGALIRFLMPMGLAFQSTAAVAWGLALWRSGPRAAGAVAGAIGAATLTALAATIADLDGLVAMAGLAGQALWVALLGGSLMRRP